MIKFKVADLNIESFKKNGFLIVEKFLNQKYIPKIQNRFDPLFRGEFATGIAPDAAAIPVVMNKTINVLRAIRVLLFPSTITFCRLLM